MSGTILARVKELPRPMAFVLSGGGSYGAVQVGMLRAMAEAGVQPDLVVGCSVGALNGVILASRPMEEAVGVLEQIWAEINRKTMFGHGLLKAAATFARTRTSALDPSNLVTLLHQYCPSRFDQLDLPFTAVATDTETGDVVLLTRGELEPALLATSAIPGLFPVVTIDGRRLVDGGTSANLPIRQAWTQGAASAVAFDAMPQRGGPARGPVSVVMQSLAISFRNQHSANVTDDPHPVVVLPTTTPDDLSSFDFRRSKELCDLGYRAVI